jgi:hypothetical protein
MTAASFDSLSTDELRQKAFDKAKADHDIGFFWDLVKHLRASAAFGTEDASTGGIGGSITDVIEIVRELMGKDLGNDEPLLRARFEDYLSH